MIKRLIIIFLILGLGYAALIIWTVKTRPNDAYAVSCYKTGERISGTTKIGFYNCQDNTTEVAISAVEWTPQSVENQTSLK